MLLFGTVWIRATLPRLRYDQLMDVGWKFLIEVAFLWLMISGVVVIGRQEGWNDVDRRCPPPPSGPSSSTLVLYASVPETGRAPAAGPDPLMSVL